MNNRPWIEKYRPTKLNNIIGQKNIINILKNCINNNKPPPHLLFYGPPGIGKTTTILSFCYEMFKNDYNKYTMELNASNERGIDIVKDKIIDFAKRRVINGKFKMVILDEADAMTSGAQTALRKIMEDYDNTRFCIICNYPEKIIPAIVSRCMEYEFKPIPNDIIKIHFEKIYEKEFKVKPNNDIIDNIIMLIDGDLRKGINMIQNLKYSFNNIDKQIFYDMEGLMNEEQLNIFITNIQNLKTNKDIVKFYYEFKRTNFSIKNIIKQIIFKNIFVNKNNELNKLLSNEINDDFVIFGLINLFIN